ncbi:hypothetical protein B5X24_HaOG203068 [Helicoverpa armigera]|uniref:Reverse transcriptase domain-containing protein n=1 Tax=Helicoverpa armigera TaxID=29058 RepID=A0A2W1BTM2_HELAM|nr:hypothetical protein B5X24_HaOG203068 [Helicoverpa armigera]
MLRYAGANIFFDWLLRGNLPRGTSVFCYADDTLLTARGRNFGEAASLASAGGSQVVDSISRLGLTVALHKTEAVFFHGTRQQEPPDAHIHVEGVRIGVQPQMKYLGIVLDNPTEKEEVREEAREAITLHWAEDLASATYGRWTLDAIGPVLNGWLDRRHGCLSMRLVQVLSGHGCFGSYLHRIGREETPQCHHCEATVDTAEHTLQVCPSWAEPRRALMAVVGNDLSLSSVIASMLGSEETWEAVASFCEDVMSQKEAAERMRENDPLAVPLSRRRRGRRRRIQRLSPSAPGGEQRATGAGAPPPAPQGSTPALRPL